MEKRVLTARTLLIGAGAMVAGMLLGVVGPASASGDANVSQVRITHTAPADNYINMFEIGAVPIEVDYGADVSRVEVRVVPFEPTVTNECKRSATPSSELQMVTFPLPHPTGGTETFVFDLSDATRAPSPFPEGVGLCALAQAWYLDEDGVTFVGGRIVESTTKPIKDTKVEPGIVEIRKAAHPDTRADWLNLAESLNDPAGYPNVGDITGVWRANPASDAILAAVWWDRLPEFDPYPAACGVKANLTALDYPAFTFSASSAAFGGLSLDLTLPKACVDLFAENEEVSLSARWRDEAGNISLLATTEAFPDGNLKIDRELPIKPAIDMFGATVEWRKPLSNSGPPIVSEDVINISNQGSIQVDASYTNADLDFIDVRISDGDLIDPNTLVVSQRRSVVDPAPGTLSFPGFNLTPLKNCGTPVANPPTHTPVAPGAPTADDRVDDCIIAVGIAVDLAGNASAEPLDETDPAMDTGFKDNVRPCGGPTVPAAGCVAGTIPLDVAWVPTLITDWNAQVTRVFVEGEPYASVFVKISDEDPSSSHLSNYPIAGHDLSNGLAKFRLDHTGFGAIEADVTTLADGDLTAEVWLVDPWANDSRWFDNNLVMRGFFKSTAIKHLSTPSLQLTSPAADSWNKATVSFAGIAEYEGAACEFCEVTIYDHPSNITNYGNAANIPLVTATTDVDGAFTATYTYVNSGHRRTFFRATDLANSSNPINGRPSAVRAFKVDARPPNVGFTTVDNQIFYPGDPVVLQGVATDDFSGVFAVELEIWQLNPLNVFGQIAQNRPPSQWLTQYRATVPGDQVTCPGCPGGLSVQWSYDFSQFGAGNYTVRARAADQAGNQSAWAAVTFTKLGN